MFKKTVLFALSTFLMTGCSTTGKKNTLELQNCQSRVNYLETMLKNKEQDISDLEYELQHKDSNTYKESLKPKNSYIESKVKISNPSATQIQKALKSAGYYKGTIDGKIGPKTQEAIIRFQKDNGLKADGKVGQMTWAELQVYLE